jgi:hypothetical protein
MLTHTHRMPKAITSRHHSRTYMASRMKEIDSPADVQTRTLLERMSNLTVTPLIDRISPHPYKPLYTPSPPLPKHLKFRKTKIMLREEEYWFMIEGVNKRIMRLKRELEIRGAINRVLEGQMEDLIDRFEDFRDTYFDRADTFTSEQWGRIRKDLRMVKTIPINSSWTTTCVEYAALGRQYCFVF